MTLLPSKVHDIHDRLDPQSMNNSKNDEYPQYQPGIIFLDAPSQNHFNKLPFFSWRIIKLDFFHPNLCNRNTRKKTRGLRGMVGHVPLVTHQVGQAFRHSHRALRGTWRGPWRRVEDWSREFGGRSDVIIHKAENTWKAKCPIFKTIVAGFRGKVA